MQGPIEPIEPPVEPSPTSEFPGGGEGVHEPERGSAGADEISPIERLNMRRALRAFCQAPNLSSDSTQAAGSVPGVLEDEQELLELDQTLAEADQTEADADQTAADRDQAAADSDQAASDRDLVGGGDPDAHFSSRAVRSRTAQQRQYSASGRVVAAGARDQVARARDLMALARDRNAEQRDSALASRKSTSAADVSERVRRGAGNRANAAADRTAAADGRARAAADREQAARDREHATRTVLEADVERDRLLARLAAAESDGLTGTRSRAAGLEDLDHELARARRTMAPLAIGYVDVVGLKVVNDTFGHAAGDALLQRAVSAIRGHLRSYDLIVRIGGDEFLAVMSGATIDEVRERFAAIHAALAADPAECRIKVGFAALEAGDSAAELIHRADAGLPARP